MITNRFKAHIRGLGQGQGQGPTKDEILNTLDKFGGKERPREDDLGSNGHSAATSDSSPASTNNDTDSACDDETTRDKGFSQSQSFSNSYCDEWERLFNRIDYLKSLRKVAMDCQLRSSRFRSVCWRVYLEVLPERQDQWIQHTRAWREQYSKLKEKYITLPRSELTKENNPCLNNPLSQDHESPWNKYFQDNELRITIRQDVIRTYPKLEFFNSESVRALMVDVLFVYAKLHPKIEYRQGMHELLAPIIFVLHCDHQAFQHACELESVGLFSEEDRELVKELLDPTFLEHDAFAMFSQIMETVEPWYHSREFTPPSKADVIVHAQPFMRPQDLQPSNVIVNKLTRIQDYLLKKIDLELYMHLERLDIAPQIYGIRWLRLLFGREFPMQDLLVVWDAIFANSICFDLVDYVFVAMLLFIRDIILSSDYPECLGILMRFPPVGDVHYMLELALHLRNPELYARPHNYTARRFPTSKQDDLYHYHNSSHRGAPVQRSQSARQTKTSTSAAAELASKFRAASVLSSFSTLTKRKNSATEPVKPSQESLGPKPLHKSSSEPMALMTETTPPRSPETTRKLSKFGKSKGSTTSLNRVEMTSSAIPAAMTQSMPPGSMTSSGQAVTSYRQGQGAASLARMEMRTVRRGDSLTDSYVNVSDGEEGRGHEATPTAGRPATLAKKPDGEAGLERSRFLQGRVNDMESMCKYCASKMDVHIEKLQGQLLKQPCLENEDEVFLALAGIKQVRDVLKGTLRFAQNLLDSDEININDNHYTPEPRAGDVMSMSLDSSLYGSRRNSDDKALCASIFYVESPGESEKSFPMRKGDGSPSSRKHSEDELSIDMDDTIAKIMTLTRRDEEFTSSTELKDIENNAAAMLVK